MNQQPAPTRPQPVTRGRLFGRLKLTDARGTLRPMLRPTSTDDRFHWRTIMTPRQRWCWGAGFVTQAMLGFAPQMFMLFNTQSRTLPWFTAKVVFAYLAVVLPASVAFIWTFVRMIKNPGVATHRLERRLCGSCCYSIDSLPSEQDGCTVCPECGAAWRLPLPPANNPE